MVQNGQRNFTEKRLADSSILHRIIESTELERTHESTPGLAPQETHYVISVAFSQKAIPVPQGRT